MGFETNLIRGVETHYGPRSTNKKFGGITQNNGPVKTAEWTWDFDDLPVSGDNKMILRIPANTYIVEAYFQVITAFAGGTTYDIDLVETDGSAIGTGEDKLWDALALASIDATEVLLELKSSTCASGSNSGNAVMAKTDAVGQLQVVATGTFTAGRARIIIEYLTVPAA
jgi:hypothetical protein|tara:strand:- start:31 stop:537 length:507 start_codon:yes stop_codon:yes gene_type:complete